MKKIANIFSTFLVLALFGCASTSGVIEPSQIEYKEISAKEYFDSYASKLYESVQGYKIPDVFIRGADASEENGIKEALITIGDDFGHDRKVYATDFVKAKNQSDPTWADRIDAVMNEKKYNGHYTVYVYAKEEGNWLDGYKTKIILYDIEGIPSQEQIDADKAEIARLQAEKEAAEAKAKAERNAKLDASAKKLAQGYTYHGRDEVEKNCKLFANGALEAGHAYYISGFIVKYSGTMAAVEYGDGLFFSSRSSSVLVDYVSQKVKAEVIEAGVTNLFGQTIEVPLEVVVAGGKGYAKTPVVLGIIEEE